jgi:tetratricopeptide (TPR) repeat protein
MGLVVLDQRSDREALMFLRRSRRMPQAKLDRLWTARSAQDPEAYLELATRSIERYPDDPEALIEMAQALSQNGRFEEAADAASQAEGLTTDGGVLVLAAWTMIHAERWERAAAVLDRVLASDPDDAVVKNEAPYLRGTTCDCLGEPEAAEQYLRDAVAGDDQLSLYIVGLAQFLIREDRHAEALDMVDRAVAIADAAERDEALGELADLGLVP